MDVGPDRDHIFGQGGSDYSGGIVTGYNPGLDGGSGNDVLAGGPGSDDFESSIGGFRGDDTVRGGNGDDQISDAAGENILQGGDGDDDIRTTPVPSASPDELPDTVSCGEGEDTVSADANDQVQADCEHVTRS